MADKRKFERLPARLEVEIRTRGRGQVCPSIDISRHGMFLATPNPPLERQLLILRIPLPDGLPPIDVMASVVRRVSADEARASNGASGCGINFFALTEENKERWEQLLAKLRGETPRPVTIGEHSSRPTFLLQPKDVERLRLFATRELALGTMFLRTPVLRQAKELLKIVLLHPVTDEELPLFAKVRQIHEGSLTEPKGMTLDFEPLSPEIRAAISDFVEHGKAPPDPAALPATSPGPPPLPKRAALAGESPAEEAISDELAEAAVQAAPLSVGEGVPLETSPDEQVFARPAPTSLPLPIGDEPKQQTPASAALAQADEPLETPETDQVPELSPEPPSQPPIPPPVEIAETAAEAAEPFEQLTSEGIDIPIPLPTPPSLRPAPNGQAPPPEDPAMNELRAGLAVAPDDVALLFRLGSALARHAATAHEALEVLQHLQEIEPHHPLANGALALAFAQVGERVAAQRHLTRARRLGQPVDSRVQGLLNAIA